MKNKERIKKELKAQSHRKVRAKIRGTKDRHRLNLFRGLKHINVQIIDDLAGKTLVSASDQELKTKKGTKVEKAKETGKLIAKKAKEKKINKVVFDRSSYKYHGRIKALVEGAREGGLEF